MPSDTPVLTMSRVTFGYTGTPVLRDISLVVRQGEMVGLLGPNASGKTTLLRLMAGTLHSQEGRVLLEGADLGRLRRREVACWVAMVPQLFSMPFSFTAREVAMMGRTPYLRALAGPQQEDAEAVQVSLEQLGIEELADRFFNDLSGGERQKVILAMAVAQGPRVLLLDEPTAHLDISRQVEILDTVGRLNQAGITVVAALHDLNLAALYFPRLVLLHHGAVFADGSPQEVLTEEHLQEVYSASVAMYPHPTRGVPQVTVLPL